MKQFLEYAAEQYYKGSPVISDQEFDTLANKYNFNSVGARSIDEVPHLYPLLSLKKCFNHTDVPANFDASSPKLDGAAVSLIYSNRTLQLALTRGDGKKGNNVTDKLLLLVPEHINIDGTFQITGEVVAPATIPNARNYASGALGLKDIEEFKTRKLAFIAYDCTPSVKPTWTSQIDLLHILGFNTVLDHEWSEFPQDGTVYRINNYDEFFASGFTSHHPKGSVALKQVKEGVITTLLDVVWQVGRSGVVAPVAIFEPVNIDGAIVTRATLHNMEYINGLELEIGCQIEVIRSGEIIPRVVRRL